MNPDHRKRMWNAVYRSRSDGHVMDSSKKIAYINEDDFIYWKTSGINPAIKFLQHNFNWTIILKNRIHGIL
ncbi:hypothetical protein KAR91_70640 [Candidatus Pacearchaeota archaeon]|nr:hypothetical protein [Candidatus Pacearchaeota archaeon]